MALYPVGLIGLRFRRYDPAATYVVYIIGLLGSHFVKSCIFAWVVSYVITQLLTTPPSYFGNGAYSIGEDIGLDQPDSTCCIGLGT
jgi:hypothetical protein